MHDGARSERRGPAYEDGTPAARKRLQLGHSHSGHEIIKIDATQRWPVVAVKKVVGATGEAQVSALVSAIQVEERTSMGALFEAIRIEIGFSIYGLNAQAPCESASLLFVCDTSVKGHHL